MPSSPFRSVVTLALLLVVTTSAQADLQSAEDAYGRKDYNTAFVEFKRLAEQGDSTAQSSLGILYELGKGVTKDFAQARYWYMKSAEQGNDNGQYNLATLYYLGQGVPQDTITACKWWSIATRSNNGAARNSMQLCLRHLDEKGRSTYERQVEDWFAAREKK